MQPEDAVSLLNKYVVDEEKRQLLQRIADRPSHYASTFCVHQPQLHLLADLLHARENRYTEAMSEFLKALLSEQGFAILSDKVTDAGGNDLNVDPHFAGGRVYYFLEHRLRDNLDTTQRENLLASFSLKLDALYRLHGERLVGVLYFFDPKLVKHRTLYMEELAQLKKEYSVELQLFYGAELFAYLGQPALWAEFISALASWKTTLSEVPIVDFDENPDENFEKIKTIDQRYWWNLILEDDLWDGGVIQSLFQSGKTLCLLHDYFAEKTSSPYPLLTRALASRLEKYYPNA